MSLQKYHVVGIVFMFLCGMTISLSDLLKLRYWQLDDDFRPPFHYSETLPMWVAVLCACIMPVTIVFSQAANKYVTIYLRVTSQDFTYGLYFVQGVVL